jgi:hypothetical protein
MQIVEKLKQLVASERKITAEIIEHIQEIDRIKIHLQMGYPSLFAFLTEHIGYSGSSAQRRIEAARLVSEVPSLKEEIKSGELNLSQVALVAQSVRQKQREEPKVEINSEDKRALLDQIKNQSFEESQKIISQTLDLEIKSLDRKVVQKNESVRMEATFSKEQMETFNQVKSLISHINPRATFAEVFEHLAKDFLKRKGTLLNVRFKNPTISVSTKRLVTQFPTVSETAESSETTTVPRQQQQLNCAPSSTTDSVMKLSYFEPIQIKMFQKQLLLEF